MKKLILASKSIYRKELLESLGVSFETRVSKINEKKKRNESVKNLASRLSREKAESVIINNNLQEVIIGADQVASIEGEELKKPNNEKIATKQLIRCKNKNILFYSAVTIIDTKEMEYYSINSITNTKMRNVSEKEIINYLRKTNPYDCSGGIKIEGVGAGVFKYIKSDDPSSILGLPLIWVSKTLKKLGIKIL